MADDNEFGPVDYLVVEFPGNKMTGEGFPILLDLVDRGIIRILDLVFVRNIGDLTDCVRAPAAQRAGVRSGVCFPIVSMDRIIGTMDFFTTEFIDLSESRASALRNVQQLVSQRLDIVRNAETSAGNARDLLDTVDRLRAATSDATRVADEAVSRASDMTGDVAALGDASNSIGDVIR